MRKQGLYTIYNNIEMEFFKDLQNNCFIRSKNPDMKNMGFIYTGRGIFIKNVDKTTLGECFKIKYIANYKGNEFNCKIKGTDKVQLISRDKKLSDLLCFTKTEKHIFSKIVLISEVELIEKKILFII